MPPLPPLLGADGCPGGWMVAAQLDGQVTLERWPTAQLAAAADVHRRLVAVIDIPIGLTTSGPRRCDLEARRELGRPRGASVFPAPLRSMLTAATYADAQRLRREIEGKGCSRQAFGIQAKVEEVDRLVRRIGPGVFHEGHPELAFTALADSSTPLPSKHTEAGRRRRWQLLRRHFPELVGIAWRPPASADALDALACLWSARRIAAGTVLWLPRGKDQLDPALGQAMRIWF